MTIAARFALRPLRPLSFLLLCWYCGLGGGVVPAAAAEAESDYFPDGVADLAGRLAHNHWYLFGESARSRLEELNRSLREADQAWRKAANDEAARGSAAERRSTAAKALVDLLRSAPGIVEVELASGTAHISGPATVPLPGESGAVLFRIRSGEGADHCATAVADFGELGGESSRVVLEAGAAGTTWAVAGFEHLPVGRTTAVVEIRRPGLEAVRVPLELRTPASGRLKLTVLSADTAQSVPAMVRLMWRVDGIQRRPANGIEFGPQFDSQGFASGARAPNLPGLGNVHFWCMPGPLDMQLSPGVWQVGVRRGIEHEVVFADVTIKSGETTELTLTPKRWVDMRQVGWWSGDDHVHCRVQSDDDARRLMSWVEAEDIHLANVVKMGDIYRTYFEQRGFGRDYRVVQGQTVLSPGQECPRTHEQIGHTLAMNSTGLVRNTDQYFLYDLVFDAVHAQGGLTGYAHVNNGNFHVHRDMSLNIPKGKVDFVELLQFNQLGTELYYDFLNTGFKITASAGSDVPWGGTVGEVRTYVYLGEQAFDADAWFKAFGQGRTFTSSGPMLDLRVEEARPGDELRVEAGRKLKVRARAWSDPGRSQSVTLELVREGDVITNRTEEISPLQGASVECEVEAGDGCWIAARARTSDGTSAHTTPVYVVRPGLRFWKHDAIESLIAKRLASLAEIERIIAEAKADPTSVDRYRQQLAIQGPALQERIDAARQIYAELLRTAAEETPRRSAQRASR